MAREIGWKETKIRFFAIESVFEGWEEADRMTSQIAQNVCLFGLCQVFER